MKIIVKLFGMSVLAAVIVFSMATCGLILDDDDAPPVIPVVDNNGPTHYTGTLIISGQVWLQNKEAKRQKDEWYFMFGGDSTINVVTGFSYDDDGNLTNLQKSAGSGKIEKGILSFEAAELTGEYFVNADVLDNFFKEYKNVAFDPPDVKGNNILPVTSDGDKLNREGLFLLNTSVGMESVMFLYVDKDCRITGDPGVITWNDSYISKTANALDISLKEGWNTLYRMEVFDRDSGFDNVSLGISNPNDFKWVLYQ